LHHILEFENDSEVIDPSLTWRNETKNKESKKKANVSSAIELLVSRSLWYLGCGWKFDDLEESTYIARDSHCVFSHKLVEFGA
jgi:hypothetical protein